MATTYETTDTADVPGRGRQASRPTEIPAKGWKDILVRVNRKLGDDHVSIIAAGVAFYFLLAIFPALASVVSVYGLFSDPNEVQSQLQQLGQVLPEAAYNILNNQLSAIAAQSNQALSWGVAAGILLTIWSTTKGVKTLMTALNVVYEEREKRGFIRFNVIALLLTLCVIVFMVVTLFLIVALPVLLGYVGLQAESQLVVSVLRWPLLIVMIMGSLALFYRYGPSRRAAHWHWVTWGALLATFLWIIGSGLFSYYVANFASYNKTYGALGAVVILLMWFYITAYVLLLAAEFNAEAEHQTSRDTTVGGEQPMGERGAHMADTLGKLRNK